MLQLENLPTFPKIIIIIPEICPLFRLSRFPLTNGSPQRPAHFSMSSASNISGTSAATTVPCSATSYAAVTPPPNYVPHNLTSLGLGYAIAITLGFLVLMSALLLASYVCCRAARHRSPDASRNPAAYSDNGIILPRAIFVAEDDSDDGNENVVLGLDQAVISSYPKFTFSRDSVGGGNDLVCSICLCEYKDVEMLRMLPDCRHYFHLTCIDAWLKLNASCPVCRNSPLPTPLSTPLSELVPLSQYSDGRRR